MNLDSLAGAGELEGFCEEANRSLARLFFYLFWSVLNRCVQLGAEARESLKRYYLESYELFPQNSCSYMFHILQEISAVGCFSLEKCSAPTILSDLPTLRAFTVADVKKSSFFPEDLKWAAWRFLFSSLLLGKGSWLWLHAPAPAHCLSKETSPCLALLMCRGDCRGKLRPGLPLLSWTS